MHVVTPWEKSSATEITIISKPNAPSKLTATALSGRRIKLVWKDNSDNESGFKIERSYDGINFSQVAVVGPNVTTYTNFGLSAGRPYCYRVRAYNAAGNSASSNIAWARARY
jgi:argonaute-like protein implicated in RNA metabolism and viral defense